MEAWLMFLSSDEPEDIIAILEAYPEFKELYDHVYDMCRSVEKIMGLFSEELYQLDRNTVQYMVDEMQAENEKERKRADAAEAEKQKVEAEKRKAEEKAASLEREIEELRSKLKE